LIEVTSVVKRFGSTAVLNGATFRIAEAQLTTILGPSGCGKSTMLRCLNRLERFDEGLIRVGDVEMLGSATRPLSITEESDLVRRVRMRVGLVFQNFNLFPHLSAFENVVEAPVTVKKVPRAQETESTKNERRGSVLAFVNSVSPCERDRCLRPLRYVGPTPAPLRRH
jgi:ABC-type polar amino acid transport system ATPase subunit